MLEQITDEVVALHVDFERWFEGTLPALDTERLVGGGETTTGRLSSAVFEAAPSLPGGLRWLSVHETWLPEAGPELHSNES